MTKHSIPVLCPCDIGTVRPKTVQRTSSFELGCEMSPDLVLPIIRKPEYFRWFFQFPDLLHDKYLVSVIRAIQSIVRGSAF